MENDNKPSDSNAGAMDIQASGGDENVSRQVQDALIKTVKEMTGRDVKDYESAVKVIKDNNSYSGKLGSENKKLREELESLKSQAGLNITEKLASLEKKLNDTQFYTENPQYKPYSNLINKFGSNPSDVIKSDEFKELYLRLSESAKYEKSKSVLESNPRLGQATDELTEAREAYQKGELYKAQDKAVSAVLKTLGK